MTAPSQRTVKLLAALFLVVLSKQAAGQNYGIEPLFAYQFVDGFRIAAPKLN